LPTAVKPIGVFVGQKTARRSYAIAQLKVSRSAERGAANEEQVLCHWHAGCSQGDVMAMIRERHRPVQAILAGTALGVAFWIAVFAVVALIAAWP
jgi:hypothetical protein